MRIKLRAVDQSTNMVEVDAIECDLAECFPGDPEEEKRTEGILAEEGWCYVGGGAAQMYLLTALHPVTSAQSQAYIEGIEDWWNTFDEPLLDAPEDVDDGGYIAERVAQRDDEPPSPYD